MRRPACYIYGVHNTKNRVVLWDGRLEEKPGPEAFAFQASVGTDARLAQDDIAGSKAHARMLAAQKIIPEATAEKLAAELDRIASELRDGSLAVDSGAEDVHSFLEGVLTERLGDEGRRVHSGRSRNDQVATDFRLYLKRVLPEISDGICRTISVLLDRADEHIESIMPGYTHLQRAQPVTLAHHLCAWAAALSRDLSRFDDALRRLDECPLGAGALAGSSLPLDREATSAELGFSRPALNSMDAVASRDFALEPAAAAAICHTNLSRFCEDIVIWASEEFKFIDIAEAWSTGSSIMPQKKNPDFAELIRGKSGRCAGNLVTLLMLVKGLPYAYNKDLQEDKEALFDSLDSLRASLEMFSGMIKSARWNTARMEEACSGGFLEATDLAEYLVLKGLPFRRAHEAATFIVRDCVAAGQKTITERPLEQLRERSGLIEEDIFVKLSPRACVNARRLSGGPAPEAVRSQIDTLRSLISDR